MVIYTGVGVFSLLASYEPLKYKTLLSYFGWFAFFLHGCVALLAVFTSQTDNYVGPILGGAIDVPETIFGYKNGDKFLVCVVWFGEAFGNIYFMKKIFGDYNLPWNAAKGGEYKAMV